MKDRVNGRVSILVPCYNHELFVSDCMDSIIDQSYTDIELLICDDCSQDNSLDIIKRYENKLRERLSGLVILSNSKNLGITKTLNKLLEQASGEFIKVIASDDMLHPKYIEHVLSEFLKMPDVDVITTNGYMINEDMTFSKLCSDIRDLSQRSDIIKDNEVYYKNAPDYSDNDETLFSKLYEGNFVFALGTTIRASVFDRFGLYDEKIIIEDWEYALRMAHEGCKFKYLDEKLCFYRINQNSISSVKYNDGLENRRIMIFEAELAIIEKYGIFLPKKKYIKKKISQLLLAEEFAKKNRLNKMYSIVLGNADYGLGEIIQYGLLDYIIWQIKKIIRLYLK
ncbi:glycosyltransferase [Butyrivibrio fibrisolvens]|uniref:glycosyltransferase n=1 Tax=Butyrivibrio fibrisolvens TaxID=831 RepID=UPI001788CC73|nr:glycosyltransferase [Butyrivibrio fibrisolvens]